MLHRRFVDHLVHGNDTEGFCAQCVDVLTLLKNDPESTLESALNACKETNYFTPRICDAEYEMYSSEYEYSTKYLYITELKFAIQQNIITNHGNKIN